MPTAPKITNNDAPTDAAAVRHLEKLGHERVALLSGDDCTWIRGGPQPIASRMDRELPGPIGSSAAGSAIESLAVGKTLFDRLWALAKPGPLAVICSSDQVAIRILLECTHHGISVPEQVARVGLEGHDLAEVFGLTSIRLYPADQAACATRMLLAELEGTTGSIRSVSAPFSLALRSTSGY